MGIGQLNKIIREAHKTTLQLLPFRLQKFVERIWNKGNWIALLKRPVLVPTFIKSEATSSNIQINFNTIRWLVITEMEPDTVICVI